MSQKMVDAVKEMVQAPSCCAELKTAGKEWLEAVGTEEQGEKAVALLAEAKADICTIDQVYDLFVSDTGKKMFEIKCLCFFSFADDINNRFTLPPLNFVRIILFSHLAHKASPPIKGIAPNRP